MQQLLQVSYKLKLRRLFTCDQISISCSRTTPRTWLTEALTNLGSELVALSLELGDVAQEPDLKKQFVLVFFGRVIKEK